MSDSICNNCEPQYGDIIKPTVNPELTPSKKGRQKKTDDSASISEPPDGDTTVIIDSTSTNVQESSSIASGTGSTLPVESSSIDMSSPDSSTSISEPPDSDTTVISDSTSTNVQESSSISSGTGSTLPVESSSIDMSSPDSSTSISEPPDGDTTVISDSTSTNVSESSSIASGTENTLPVESSSIVSPLDNSSDSLIENEFQLIESPLLVMKPFDESILLNNSLAEIEPLPTNLIPPIVELIDSVVADSVDSVADSVDSVSSSLDSVASSLDSVASSVDSVAEDINIEELIKQVDITTDNIEKLKQIISSLDNEQISESQNDLPIILPQLSTTDLPELVISSDKNTNVSDKEVIDSQNITIDHVLELLEDLKSPERQDIAADPYTHPEVLENLSIDADLNVRFNVAGNPNTPPSALETLSKDSEIIVRQVVAKNPHTPSDILEILSTDDEPSVRESVTKNPILKPETRLYFIENYIKQIFNEFIRPYKPNFLSTSQQNIQPTSSSTSLAPENISLEQPTVASNIQVESATASSSEVQSETTPNTVSESLSTDIQQTPPEIEYDLANLSIDQLRIIAKDPNTSAETLEKLSTNEDYHVRRAVAENPKTPVDVLVKLSTDEISSVRRKIAKNPNTPTKVLKQLSRDIKKHVSELATKNLRIKSEDTPSSTSTSSTAKGTPSTTETAKPPAIEGSSSSAEAITPSEQESDDEPFTVTPPTTKNKINSIFSKFINPLATNKYFKDLLKKLKILKTDEDDDDEDSTSSQKNKKKESEKKGIKLPKAIKNVWNSILNFFGEIIKAIIMYKVLEWISNPENTKKLIVMIRFFERLIKFLIDVTAFITSAFLDSLSFVIETFPKLVKFTTDFVSLFMWLSTFLPISPIHSLLKAIQLIPELFTKLVEFFTKTIPEALLGNSASAAEIPINIPNENDSDTSTEKLNLNESSNKQLTSSVNRELKNERGIKGIETPNATPTSPINDNTGFLTPMDTSIDLMLPKLTPFAKGGIVTKPELSLIGEAGPEAVIPLSQFGSSSLEINNKQLSNTTSKIVPEFMKLLLLPFKVIGAGIISNIQGVVSEYPTLIPLVGNEISLIASTFGIPRTLVNVAAKDFGKINLNNLNDFNTTDSILSLFGKSPIINEVTKSEDDTAQNKTEFKKQNDDSVRGLLGDILNALIYKNTSKSKSPTGNSPTNPTGAPTSSHISQGENPFTVFPETQSINITPPSNFDNNADFTTRTSKSYRTGSGIAANYGGKPLLDSSREDVVLNSEAMESFGRMIKFSKGVIKSEDITSSKRSEKHNASLPGHSPTSNHLRGLSLDVRKYSKTARWMLEYGEAHGWYALRIQYPEHIHFDYFPERDKSKLLKNSPQSQIPLPNITSPSASVASLSSGDTLNFAKSKSNDLQLAKNPNSIFTVNLPTINTQNTSNSAMVGPPSSLDSPAAPYIQYVLST